MTRYQKIASIIVGAIELTLMFVGGVLFLFTVANDQYSLSMLSIPVLAYLFFRPRKRNPPGNNGNHERVTVP